MLPNDTDKIINNLPRLQWACRRGMLELDVLLGSFLKAVYPMLTMVNKKLFVKLLNHADPDLFSWLMGHSCPNDADLAHIVGEIRRYAQRI